MSRKVDRPLFGRQVCVDRQGSREEGRLQRDRDHEGADPSASYPAVRCVRESQADLFDPRIVS